MLKFAQPIKSKFQAETQKKSLSPKKEGVTSSRDQDTTPLKKVLYERLQKLKEDTKKGVTSKKEHTPKDDHTPMRNSNVVQAPTPVASWWRTMMLQKRAVGKSGQTKSQESKKEQA